MGDQGLEKSSLQLVGGDAVRIVFGGSEGDGEVASESLEDAAHRRADLVLVGTNCG